MALQYLVYLDDNLVDEPVDLSALELSIIRDDDGHGIGFEASTSTLTFVGNGADYIVDQKTVFGNKANIVIKILVNCEDDSDEFDEIKGKLDMGTYKRTCGSVGCKVAIAMESVTCETIMNARFDQKVDIDKPQGFDGITALQEYADMNFPVTLPSIALKLLDKASNTNDNVEVLSDQPTWHENVTSNGFLGNFIPRYENVGFSALGSFNVGSFQELFDCGANNTPDINNCGIPVTVNTEEILGDIKCALSNVKIDLRWHGRIDLITDGAGAIVTGKQIGRAHV